MHLFLFQENKERKNEDFLLFTGLCWFGNIDTVREASDNDYNAAHDTEIKEEEKIQSKLIEDKNKIYLVLWVIVAVVKPSTEMNEDHDDDEEDEEDGTGVDADRDNSEASQCS